jgi:uncharacterized membrane protein YhiD involved in acid resistance
MVHVYSPLPQDGIPLSRARSAIGQGTAIGALLFVLALIGSPVFCVMNALRLRVARAIETHRQREEDRKVWQLALTDRRVMSDLVALRQQSPIAASEYF